MALSGAALYMAVPVGFAIGIVLIAFFGGSKPVIPSSWSATDETARHKKDDDVPALGSNDATAAEHTERRQADAASVAAAAQSDERAKAVTKALFGHDDVDRIRREVAAKRAELEERENAHQADVDQYKFGRGFDARMVRHGLDVCTLVLIAAAIAAVLVYEYKVDPVVELARLFPREVSAIEAAWSRIRALS